jgi:hypothetical protein
MFFFADFHQVGDAGQVQAPGGALAGPDDGSAHPA